MIPLQVGTHNYVDFWGPKRIELIPIRTTVRGLCYKMTLSNPLPLNPERFLFFISNFIQSEDKLEKMNLMIAANDTWQGIIGNYWPYSKGQKISKGLFMMSQ